ncbi:MULTISPECIES: BTAD domain-containing putative transcriptional regulator [Streptomyces]|uniref:BTAD domain-containing putative transcriptional regulator n=1 Tax=Streptomyces edwardsiae TaxID=3075527 RepID=A0ABU2PV04_9ACTN|nr:BTAD domain-containing putative transcriptional regulator [Streptomyces sp. DSM 41636]MDT0395120.1 BTAD domain-containing putative transcriptional regulator [Streptomyces sp. DSM 41636]
MDHYVNSLRFAVLGPVRAWRGKRELDLGSPQQKVVLAVLLLRRGRPVPLGELLDAVWGEEPPVAAVSVLRTYVSRLRKVLEPDRGPAGQPRVVVSVGDGYALRIPDDALDLAVFQRRVVQAKQARAAGDVSGAAELLHTALGGWRGAALAGLPGPLSETVCSWLDEEWLTALEARLDLDIALGRHHEVIAELIPLTGTYPLREELCRLLMLALYRSGRQAEALAAYRGTRGALVKELGIEPGAGIQDLHDRILAADPTLLPPRDPEPAAGPAAAAAPVPARAGAVPADGPATAGEPEPDGPGATDPRGRRFEPARPAQLPPDLPTFAGRHTELDRTGALLPQDGSPPSTVVVSAIGGMGGIGKSTLAVHWAHCVAGRFPGGQLYINLRGFDPTGSAVTPDDAVRTFLDALGVPPMRIPAGRDAQVALYRSLLAGRKVLILLDNARDAEQVRPLLPGSPGCLVIVTSRNRLTGLVASEGAHLLTLDQLPPAEAYDLLALRLGADRLAAEPEAADEIIARCGRLPLALAIVAAHAYAHPAFPLRAIADEVSESHGSLDAFTGGDDITTDVRAVFSWSYRALTAPAARLFRLLGVHAGPDISVPAAGALAGLPPREARGLLAELTRAHLLTEHYPGRFTLHDLLRVYAAERVRAEETREERELALRRLLSWYLHTADAAYAHITPNRRRVPLEPRPEECRPLRFTTHEQALDWCETERSNLVAAVHEAERAGQTGIAWRLPAVLWGFFYLRSHVLDWLDTSRTGLAAARAAGSREGEARALSDTAAALRNAGRTDEAIAHLHKALELRQELGDREGRSSVISNLGDAYLHAGRLDKAVEYTRRGLAVDRLTGDVWGEGIALSNLGDAYQRMGRYDDALGCLERALVVLRAGGNRWVEGVTLDILGTVHHRLGRHGESVEHYRRALATHRDIGNRWGEGHTLGHLGDVRLDAGEPEAARASWRQALAIFAEFGHPDAEGIRERLARLRGGTAEARATAQRRTA